jgi:lipoprotein-releasing system ATP-binding protein
MSPDSAPTGLLLQDIHKSFQLGGRDLEVLRGLSLHLAPGEALAVTGPSGSGKSTLLHLMGTLDRPSSGSLSLDGRNLLALAGKELARFRNREIHHLLPQYTVLENVLLPTLAFPGEGPGNRERARDLLSRVGLGERLDHRPAELSGGERQRVAVARGLIQKPSLLLCDEPTGSLDRGTATTVADLLLELHEEESNILVVVTHSLELAGRFSRRCQLEEGRCSEA